MLLDFSGLFWLKLCTVAPLLHRKSIGSRMDHSGIMQAFGPQDEVDPFLSGRLLRKRMLLLFVKWNKF